MTKKSEKKKFPFVSVCTPTFNRRPFIPIMFECFMNQDYPKHRIEWIIVDDGTDKVKDLMDTSKIPQIKYFELDRKMNLGEKRNYMHSKCSGSIIVYMDDDDYYPPARISHAVERLLQNPTALCAGASEMYVYFKHIHKMYQSGPYGPNHATAGTFAFRKELLLQTSYENHAALAEEKAFLKNYTIPFVQLDPMKSILVFSHEHNTFDKRKLLDNIHPDFFKESDKTVDMFIRTEKEKSIKQFFLKDIDELLKTYEPGEPKMKPEVLKQIKEIEKERDRLQKEMEEQQKQQMLSTNTGLMMQLPDGRSLPLTNENIIQIINDLNANIANLNATIANLTKRNQELEEFLRRNMMQGFPVPPPPSVKN